MAKAKALAEIRPSASAFEKNVLLLDANESRSFARATALRTLGATVQCVRSGEEAGALWKPGSHQLIAIQLSNDDGEGFRKFQRAAQSAHPEQVFAFYRAEPPYLFLEPGLEPKRSHRPAKPVVVPTTTNGRPDYSMTEAARRITALAPARRQATNDARDAISDSFSEAVKAAERSIHEKD
jgi:hypothetical protein